MVDDNFWDEDEHQQAMIAAQEEHNEFDLLRDREKCGEK